MLMHMRTTIELSDALLARARKLARKRGTSVRALVEEGLRRVLEEQPPSRYRLPDASFRGDGLVEGLDAGDWERVRELAYEGRGG